MQKDREKIRSYLKRNKLTVVWLINRLQERGIVTDKAEMSCVFAELRNGPKVDSIVKTSLQILNDYESKFAAPKAP